MKILHSRKPFAYFHTDYIKVKVSVKNFFIFSEIRIYENCDPINNP